MAYAGVVSLKQTLDPFLDSGRSKIQIHNSDLELIYDHLCYLKSFLDKVNSLEKSESIEELDKKLTDVVQNAQDLIESHLSDPVHARSEGSISRFFQEVVEVKDELGSLVKLFKEKEDGRRVGPGDFQLSSLEKDHFKKNNLMVGLDDELLVLQNCIHGLSDRREVISIVGMPGLGKTTLAKAAYSHPLTVERFYVRIFVEVGVEYELKTLLVSLLDQVIFKKEVSETVDELRNYLYKLLFFRRYLVVLDDIWDSEVLNELLPILPDDSIGSRIILTTRITRVCRGVCKEGNVLQKRFLALDDSWNLFSRIAFRDRKECPKQLERIGKKIVENLEGLPLPIIEIGELLSKSPLNARAWMAVAEDTHSLVYRTTIPEMRPSYAQLPQHLKACFLYLGLFPPKYNFRTAELVKLWVAEGFIEPVANQTLEQKAEEYLADLVSRNLVIVNKLNSRGRIKTCSIIHLLLHYLCVREARQEKVGTASFRKGTNNQRRLAIQGDVSLGVMGPVSAIRSLIFISKQNQDPLQVFPRFRLLRVLHAPCISNFPDGVLKLVRLRYLVITCDGEVPSSISTLRNLEVFIIHRSQTINSTTFLPLEIWKLHKLRHLQCVGLNLPDPSVATATGQWNDLFFNKLLTLSGVSLRTCTEGVLARMPNLIKLGVLLEPIHQQHTVEASCFSAVLTDLLNLESFKCALINRDLRYEAAYSLVGFPYSLKKLTLSGCGFLWHEHMTIISQLPCLQVLKLRLRAFCGPKWELFEGGFQQLEFLLLEDLDIEYFIAESCHFPILQQLHIRRCNNLKEIPINVGEIPTLEVIKLDDCNVSANNSARILLEELEEMGYDYLQVRINSSFNGR